MAASETLQARVERALAQLTNPRSGTDVVTAGMVKDLAVDPGGTVTLTRIDASGYAGTFDMTFSDNSHVTGNFTALR